MTVEETGKLLGFAALYDSRRVEVPDVMAWHRIVGDLPYADAETAVAEHYADSTERLMPAHVRQRVATMRAERLRLNPVPAPPPELLDDPAAYRKHLRDSAKQIADGEPGMRMIGGGS